MYDVYGETRLRETDVDWLDGYRGSRPVRFGNGAHSQTQFDIYGEMMTAIVRYVEEGRDLSRETRKLVAGIGNLIAKRWKEPDNGIWELRSGKKQHIHSKVLCWLALDAAIRISEKQQIKDDVDGWKRERAAVRQYVFREGYDRDLNSFVRTPGTRMTDGALLVMPLVGFIDGGDPRMTGTLDAIRQQLGRGPLIYRYRGLDDSMQSNEGCFLACSFWFVGALAHAGRQQEADRMFRDLIHRGTDLGLFSEEMDPETGAFLGNFPQALTHIALINAALDLAAAEEGQKRSRGKPQGTE